MSVSPQSPCQITPCQTVDFEGVFLLLKQLWPNKPLNATALRSMFEHASQSPNQCYLCARSGDRVVGFGSLTVKSSLWEEGDVGYVNELVVDQAFRRRGIGESLINRLSAEAKGRGCRAFELDCSPDRHEAMKFYVALEFASRAQLLTKRL